MSPDTTDPAVEVTTDHGHQPTAEERLAAISSEAIDEFDSGGITLVEGEPEDVEGIEPVDSPAEDAEGAEDAGEPSGEEADATEDAQTEEDAEDQIDVDSEDAESQEEDEKESEPIGMDWDGDPDTIPDQLRPGYEKMMKTANKGINKLMREMAEERKQMQTMQMQYQQALLQVQQQQRPQADQSSTVAERPTPPGEGATAADWQEYDEKNILYVLQKTGIKPQSGPDPELAQQVAELKWKTDLANRVSLIANQPGATDEILLRMQSMAAEDEKYLDMYQTDEGAIKFFEEAKLLEERAAFELEKKEILSKAAELEKAKAARKAGAAGRATPRPGSAKAAVSPEDTFKKKAFNSVEEQLAYLSEETRKEVGL